MNKEEFLKHIYERLNMDERNTEFIKEQIEEMGPISESTIYKNILNTFIHINLSNNQSKEHLKEIFKVQDRMEKELNHPVSLHTAIIEYFSKLNIKLEKPFIIENQITPRPGLKKIRDDITGVYNKKYGYELLEKEVSRAARYDNSLSIMILNIDNFKMYNKTFSHEFGDKILKHAADIFRSCIRGVDFVYRSNGTDFVFVFPETPALGALEVGNRIRKKLMNEYVMAKDNDELIAITISGGISSFKVDAENLDELLEFAVETMSSARKDGGNKIYLYYQEKRKFVRLDAYCKVGYKVMEGNHKTTFTKNISAGGVLFEASHFVNLNSILEVTIQIPDIDWIITAIGKVIRIEQLPNGKYDIGIFFTEIDPEDQNTILKYIQNKLNPKFNIY